MTDLRPEFAVEGSERCAQPERNATKAFREDALAASGDQKQTKHSDNSEQIRVLTFNIAEDGKFGVPGVIELIRKSKADVVGLQEAGDNTARIAKELGYYYVLHGDTAILSRFKIASTTEGGGGAIIETDKGNKFAFFDEHLYYKPYQPYQLLGIPYDGSVFIKTEAEAIDQANKARGADVQAARSDVASLKDTHLPTILVGDFNEPSYLDWTEAAAKAGRHPIKVEWPATKAFADDGFKDSYRQLHPDEMDCPGYTWTPTTALTDPKDHHDRIDYVTYRGDGIKAKSSEVIGENAKNADIVVSPFPSDHRAVTTVFDLGEQSK